MSPDPDHLRSERGREALRRIYGAPSGRPPFEPQRRFEAAEEALAGYGRLFHEAEFGDGTVLDGVVGARVTRTSRDIAGASVISGAIVPVDRSTSDTDVLPNATARLRFGDGFHRKIVDRVVTSSDLETIDGIAYAISRPRDVGDADLRRAEASGRYFFDFPPGALAGFGTFGSFTFVDSEVKGGDPLSGEMLQGLSKHDHSAGLLYDRRGLSGRLVHTYRSRYCGADATGAIAPRPIGPTRVDDVFAPTLPTYVRPAGRLDFSGGYDVTDAIRFDVGGVDILGRKTRTHNGERFINQSLRGDEIAYTLGL